MNLENIEPFIKTLSSSQAAFMKVFEARMSSRINDKNHFWNTFVSGTEGVGKSELMYHVLIQLLKYGFKVCLTVPHELFGTAVKQLSTIGLYHKSPWMSKVYCMGRCQYDRSYLSWRDYLILLRKPTDRVFDLPKDWCYVEAEAKRHPNVQASISIVFLSASVDLNVNSFRLEHSKTILPLMLNPLVIQDRYVDHIAGAPGVRLVSMSRFDKIRPLMAELENRGVRVFHIATNHMKELQRMRKAHRLGMDFVIIIYSGSPIAGLSLEFVDSVFLDGVNKRYSTFRELVECIGCSGGKESVDIFFKQKYRTFVLNLIYLYKHGVIEAFLKGRIIQDRIKSRVRNPEHYMYRIRKIRSDAIVTPEIIALMG